MPSTYSSGNKRYQGKITKQGNKWLRWAIVEAAQRGFRGDEYLRDFYEKINKKKGSKIARVAVARSLLEIIYWIWIEKRPYYKKPITVAL